MAQGEIEEQAEDYAVEKLRECDHEVVKINEDGVDVAYILWHTSEVEQAFQDGAKWGEEHAIEWHDLRKDPNDLPKESSNFWCKWRDGTYCIEHYFEVGGFCEYVIAWCEPPHFKDKE